MRILTLADSHWMLIAHSHLLVQFHTLVPKLQRHYKTCNGEKNERKTRRAQHTQTEGE